jgi:methylated-DNA-[protein]-cysteine S-methyltransferase
MFVEEEQENGKDTEILREAIKQFDEYFKGIRKAFNLKCEMEGTDFQKAAWTALMEIPYGKTISYKEQAINIGIGYAGGLDRKQWLLEHEKRE